MKRVILHSDLNNCYASIECLHRPELRGLPVAVGGNAEKRHGIVLAKNDIAKAHGVKTGEALWEARGKCPGLVVLPPNFPLYVRFCQAARNIYSRYTDQVEPFGMDECWLDVTGSIGLYESGKALADEIRHVIREELGLTVSVGVAENKIFAKLGSDMKKPDATTVITRENFRELIWPLPVSELLGVGRSTCAKLNKHGIFTIGQLASATPEFVHFAVGSKMGPLLHDFANGLDQTPVMRQDQHAVIKSIGNSTTTPRDLVTEEDVRVVMTMLAESVAARLREHGLYATGVQIHLRDRSLFTFERQGKLAQPSHISGELVSLGMELFRSGTGGRFTPLRSIGIRGIDLVSSDLGVQLDIFSDDRKRRRADRLEHTVDDIRRRFGHDSILRASMLRDDGLEVLDAKTAHILHPVGFFKEQGE